MRFHDLAIDRPDEGRQLAGDRRGDDGRPLALPGERPKAPAQPHLRFPGNLAHRPRCGRHLYLLLAANTWRIPIAPSSFDQDTPRPTTASLGDTAAVDRVSCGAFGGYETEIPPSTRGDFESATDRRSRPATVTAATRSIPRIACKAVTTSARDHSGTASRIACSRRSTRSLSWRTAPRSSSSTIRCSRCSSFCSMSQFMWAGPHVFLPG